MVGGISVTWLRFAVGIAVGVLQTPILFANLPAAELGIWYLFLTAATFLAVVDLGLPSAFGRAVSYAWGRAGAQPGSAPASAPAPGQAGAAIEASVPDLYVSALSSYTLVTVLAALVGWPIITLYFSQLALPPDVLPRAQWALAIFLVGLVANMAAMIPNACLNGLGDVGWDAGVRTITQILGFGAIALLLPRLPDIRVLAAIYAGQGVAALLLGHVILLRRHAALFAAPGRLVLPVLRQMYTEAWPMFVTRAGGWMILEANPVIIGQFLGPEKIPDYAALRQLILLGANIPTAVPIGASPFAAAAYAAGDLPRVRSLYLRSVRLATAIATLWTVGVLVWGGHIMDLWVGPGHFLGYGVLSLLALSMLLETHHSAHAFFVWSAGRWPFAPWAIAGGVLNVILASLGARWYGYVGVAAGTLLAQLVTNNWYTVYFALRHLGVSLAAYVQQALVPISLYGLALLALALGLSRAIESAAGGGWSFRQVPAPRVLSVLLGAPLTAALGTALLVVMIMTAGDRLSLRQVVGQQWLRVRALVHRP